MDNPNIDDIREHAIKADADDLDDKVERWAYLIKIQYDGYLGSHAVPYLYYTEAKYCWYYGNFLATIVLAQMALEDLLRTYFEVAMHGKFASGKKSSNATFAQLINEALSAGYIESEEAERMHYLRKELRNQYVHNELRDVKVNIRFSDKEPSKETRMPSFIALDMKIRPVGVEKNVEHEARESITILIEVFTSIALRSHGF